MFIIKKKSNKAGVTLVELLVSLLLTTIVVTIVFYIYLSSSKAYLRWERESSFTNVARLIISSLDNSIAGGTKIVEADNSSLSILSSNLKINNYERDNTGRLYKNGIPIIPEGYRLKDIEFNYVVKSADDSITILNYDQLDLDGDFRVSEDELKNITGISYEFILVNNKKQGYFKGLAIMRNY